MKAFMEKPEVQEKMKEVQTQQQKIDAQLMVSVHRVLDRRQSAAYKKLLGAPFDLTKLRPGRGGFGNPDQADSSSNAKAKSGFDDDEESPKPSTSVKAAKTQPPPNPGGRVFAKPAESTTDFEGLGTQEAPGPAAESRRLTANQAAVN